MKNARLLATFSLSVRIVKVAALTLRVLRSKRSYNTDKCHTDARKPWQFAVALVLLISAISIASTAQTFSTFLNFDQTTGANPYGTLIQGTDGNFYGTSQWGGTIGYGNVFKITPEGVATSIYSFCRHSVQIAIARAYIARSSSAAVIGLILPEPVLS